MFKLSKPNDHKDVRFCERCGSVCDATCFEQESRRRALEQLMQHGRLVV